MLLRAFEGPKGQEHHDGDRRQPGAPPQQLEQDDEEEISSAMDTGATMAINTNSRNPLTVSPDDTGAAADKPTGRRRLLEPQHRDRAEVGGAIRRIELDKIEDTLHADTILTLGKFSDDTRAVT